MNILEINKTKTDAIVVLINCLCEPHLGDEFQIF